ncbi:MAG: galactose-1-phosphate uridylyltransferase [Planctomycetes bacterium]|nr:galactose-1-phosphate uridylyltransferase [Planctomycetota bacterium]
MNGVWEQRWHPLRREWVIVAAHRQDRPWLGETVAATPKPLPVHDPNCTFCPGNTRVSGARNPAYTGVFVFDNDRPCAGPDAPRDLASPPGIYRNQPANGLARVVCFSPRHDLTLARMAVPEIDAVLACWQQQYRDLGGRDGIAHVLIFENKGDVVGVSNPHPHGQIYATNFVFTTIANEVAAGREHFAAHRRALWEDIVATEVVDGRRLIAGNADAVAFVPYFARYAYETFVGPRRAVPSIADLTDDERRALAAVLHEVLVRFDNLWRLSFPYVMALHNAPTDGHDHAGFGFHIEFHPPLRKPGLLKYLAGPEIGGGSFLADTAPEDKAAELRAVPAVHYENGSS